MWWLVLAASVESCKVWTCADQKDPTVCLTWQANSVSVNTVGCTDYLEECTYSKVVEAMDLAASGTYKCEVADSSQDSSLVSFVSCGKREPVQRRLKEGSFPKECKDEGEEDLACELVDGSMLPCRCGLDGKYYCQPNPSDEPFQEFWSACDQEGHVVLDSFFQYYKLKHELYVEMISAPDCVPKLIYEFSKLSSTAPQYSAAIVLAASVLVLL